MTSSIPTYSISQDISRRITESDEFRRVMQSIGRGDRVLSLSGLISPSAKALLVSLLMLQIDKKVAIICQTNADLEQWERDLAFWSAFLTGERSNTVAIPSFESDPYAGASPHAETLERRALALWQLSREKRDVLATARAVLKRTLSPERIQRLGLLLNVDEDHSPESLVELMISTGYVREDPVRSVGEFSLRGGILDCWSPGEEQPVRVEFFGDTVDSIRTFDPETQLSTGHIKSTAIAPMREFAVTADDLKIWTELANERWHEERYDRTLRDRTDHSVEGEEFAGWEWLIPLSVNTQASLFEYIKDSILIIDEPAAIENNLAGLYSILEGRFAEIEEQDEIGLRPDELYLTVDELRESMERFNRVEFRALGRTAATLDESFQIEAENPELQIGKSRSSKPLFLFSSLENAAEVDLKSLSTRRYHGRIEELSSDLRRDEDNLQETTILVLPGAGYAERMSQVLSSYKVDSRIVSPLDAIEPVPGLPLLTTGKLSGGFELPWAGIKVHVESDLFDEAAERVPEPRAQSAATGRRRRSKSAAFISDFRDLKVGDFVVHIDHGIGKFGGLQILELQGSRSEFMLLYYADNAKLYVPVERLDLVQRYSSGEGGEPQLDRLGGLGWHKTKAKAKRAMKDMADQLLKLYAERRMVQGHSFSKDSPWQLEFEDAFEFTLTPDQESSIEETKRDMEQAVPMDRLLCGDVGYGKTEVAMRAAFKSVMDAKQVAVLTPTTVLAYQHYETFKARFAPFPVNVELLSRFRSPKEQKAVVAKVAKGEVDILIGTHRILSKDITFQDLGLVIVDEEQRFGVAHKERLKQLKKRVDVLTMTATPIPRTLNMSLMGMRDMSIIETPPRDRLAIQTQVVQFSESVIKSAVELELSRGGQIFFIHNRVESIETIAALLHRLVPQARVAVAHGQMNEKEMEDIMLDFIHYKYDLLVATTIIENGIDIPRANTIIINRADRYGLSQLYQLRGRVGRSNRRAYAYLLIPSEHELTPIARRRLAAIREFSDLGAGFRVAALDLELRGAGNLLGGEQSGHMDALGFDLYTQMLERTVSELRGEVVEEETSVSINLGVDVSIPQEYIQDMGQRLRVYKRVSSAKDEETLQTISRETEDRYGKLPESVQKLFDYSRLRRVSESLGVISIDRIAGGVAIKFREKANVDPTSLMRLVNESQAVSFSPSGLLRINVSEEQLDNLLEMLYRLLLSIAPES
jgi:transcription-repair coupling factor (superfamily II helicase)